MGESRIAGYRRSTVSYRNVKTKRLLQTGAALVVACVLMIPVGGPTAAFAVSEADPPAPTPTPTPAVATPTPEPTQTSVVSPSPSLPPAPVPSVDPAPDSSAQAQVDVQPLAAAVPAPSGARISTSTDAYGSAIAASKAMFPNGAGTVIITPGAYPVFSSAAAGLAAEVGGPVLPVLSGSIPAAILSELRRLRPSAIIAVGGYPYLSTPLLNALKTVTANVRHIGGATLYEASRRVFEQSTARADTIYLTAGNSNEDPALAATLAAVHNRRVLVVSSHSAPLDQLTISTLRAAGTRSIVVVRSNATVPAAYEAALRSAGFGVSSLSNADPALLASSAAVSGPRATTAIVVNPSRRHDLAIAATVAGAMHVPLYFARYECLADAASSALTASGARVLAIGDTGTLSAAAATGVGCTAQKAALQSSLDAAIRATMAQWSGTYTVTVRQLGGLGETVSIGSGIRREPASMMKLFAAWAILTRAQMGWVNLNSVLPSGVTLGACLKVMIHASDNYCHTDIVHWIGIPAINKMIKDAGFANTAYGSVPVGTSVLYAGNRTTSNDLALLMQRLDEGSLLNRSWSDHLLGLMRSQIWRSRIASGIPPGIAQASKPGSLWIASGLTQGDTAIVYGSRYKYALSIMGDDNPPRDALKMISRTVYEHFNGTFGLAKVYPVDQMVTVAQAPLCSSPRPSIVAWAPAGTAIEVIDAQREWYLVRWGTRQLWMHHTYLKNR